MLLIISFPNETIPFIMNDSDNECIRAIETAKKQGWEFSHSNMTLKSDFVRLYASHKRGEKKPSKRYYTLKDRILLITSADLPDEIMPTKELLAYENNCDATDICSIEI